MLSHESAAVIHGLPVVGRWPAVVHQLISPRTGGRSTPDRIRHAAEFDAADVVERDGLALTGLARTLIDLVRSASAFKLREDALRREARAFTRWDYEVGMSTTRLAARLALIGVVPERAPRLGWR